MPHCALPTNIQSLSTLVLTMNDVNWAHIMLCAFGGFFTFYFQDSPPASVVAHLCKSLTTIVIFPQVLCQDSCSLFDLFFLFGCVPKKCCSTILVPRVHYYKHCSAQLLVLFFTAYCYSVQHTCFSTAYSPCYTLTCLSCPSRVPSAKSSTLV